MDKIIWELTPIEAQTLANLANMGLNNLMARLQEQTNSQIKEPPAPLEPTPHP